MSECTKRECVCMSIIFTLLVEDDIGAVCVSLAVEHGLAGVAASVVLGAGTTRAPPGFVCGICVWYMCVMCVCSAAVVHSGRRTDMEKCE